MISTPQNQKGLTAAAGNSVVPLRPVALLALRAAAVGVAASAFTALPAHAVPSSPSIARYALNYTTTSGTGSLTGYMDIDINSVGASTSFQGKFSDASWFKALNLNYFNGTTTTYLTQANFNYLNWDPISPPIDWETSLVPQFYNLAFGTDNPILISSLNLQSVAALNPDPAYALVQLEGGIGFGMTDLAFNNQFDLTSTTKVPAPLPILGAGAAFSFSRKLRRRQKLALRVVSTPAPSV